MIIERFKNLRLEFGLSQVDIATILNVTKQSISNWESGKRKPNIVMLADIAQFFDVTTDYLLGNSDYPVNESNNTILNPELDLEILVYNLMGTQGLSLSDKALTRDEVILIENSFLSILNLVKNSNNI